MIQDFGEKIEGAAKDRWRRFTDRLAAVPDAAILSQPLSTSFPEPNYNQLIKDGESPFVVTFIRVARDSIPAKPGPSLRSRRQEWASNVSRLRNMCRKLISGQVSPDTLFQKLGERSAQTHPLWASMRAYELLGHERSLKGYDFRRVALKSRDLMTFNPPREHWCIENKKHRFLEYQESLDDLIEALRTHLEARDVVTSAARPKRSHFMIYSYGRSADTFWIGRKSGKSVVDLFSFQSVGDAKAFVRDHFDKIVERFEQLKRLPPERRDENADRIGPDYRMGRDVTPAEFSHAFGFRGVQFGNYVEGPRRQQELNNAYDALMDLAGVLGCPPAALSLDGTLGLAFGARGRGGRDAAAAHFERVQFVINLTKGSGAGALAHEWFHALDSSIGRRSGSSIAMATSLPPEVPRRLTLEDRPAIDAMIKATASLAKMPLQARSAQADRFRSSRYFSLPEEVAARAFEAWVIAKLDRQGCRNDYLANVQPEEVYDAEDQMLGLNKSRYPYPRRSEVDEVSRTFDQAFGPGGALSAHLGAIETDEPIAVMVADLRLSKAAESDDEGRFEIDDDEQIEFG